MAADKFSIGQIVLSGLLIAAVSYASWRASQEAPGAAGPAALSVPRGATAIPAAPGPAAAPAGTSQQNPTAAPAAATNGAGWDLGRIVAALQTYAAGFDGQITAEEIQSIATDLERQYGPANWRPFVMDQIRRFQAGEAQAVLEQALRDLGRLNPLEQAAGLQTVTDWMRRQGFTWEQIQSSAGAWAQQVLKVNPRDWLPRF